MTRRTLLAAAGAAALQHSLIAQTAEPQDRLSAPPDGHVPVAFPISDGAVIIDYSGPWEVFQDTQVPSGDRNVPGFELYTVASTTDPVTVSGGMRVIPRYTFANAPAPKVIVIPAQSGGDAMLEWIRKASAKADLTMSVCTGAFLLAKTGMLAGKTATTHHGSYSAFAMQFRDVKLKRGLRFVEAGSNLASAGGLSSGIDLALRVVERYYGRFVAERTAFYMEYQGAGWKDPVSNAVYAEKPKGDNPVCAVCGMAVSKTAALQVPYQGVTYRFCTEGCKAQFEHSPADFAS
jgi:putative intracellular protease/amidase/YHS domain-containing protein